MQNKHTAKKIIGFGALLCALAVLLGAFGAHFIFGYVSDAYKSTWKTAAAYQFYHSLGILFIGLLHLQITFTKDRKALQLIYRLLLLGTILFSGSLYLMALGRTPFFPYLGWLGAITPLGGLILIGAWLYLAKVMFTTRT